MGKHLRIGWIFLAFGLLLLGAACDLANAPRGDAAPVSATSHPEPVIDPKATTSIPTPTITPQAVIPQAEAQEQPSASCLTEEEQAFAEGIADSHSIPVERIIEWRCADNEFEDIMLALETVQDVEITVEGLLDRRQEGQSWDQIWNEIGLVP